jgi:hypothetical protein
VRSKNKKELTVLEISVCGMVPESVGQLTEWCESMLFELHLQQHKDPRDEYCLDLYQPYVLGHDIKDMLVMTYFNVSLPPCALKVVCCMETGWGNQMNSNAPIGFCSANVDMICLRFKSMGCVNNPACWSLF